MSQRRRCEECGWSFEGPQCRCMLSPHERIQLANEESYQRRVQGQLNGTIPLDATRFERKEVL